MVEINLEMFKKASKKILKEQKFLTSLSASNEVLARGLGFKNYHELKKSMTKNKVSILPAFCELSETEIINNYIFSKEAFNSLSISIAPCDIWIVRGVLLLEMIIFFNKKMFELGLLDFSFKTILKLTENLNLINEIDCLRRFNIPSEKWGFLKQEDVIDFTVLDKLKSIPGYIANKEDVNYQNTEFLCEKMNEALLIMLPQLYELAKIEDAVNKDFLKVRLSIKEKADLENKMLIDFVTEVDKKYYELDVKKFQEFKDSIKI